MEVTSDSKVSVTTDGGHSVPDLKAGNANPSSTWGAGPQQTEVGLFASRVHVWPGSAGEGRHRRGLEQRVAPVAALCPGTYSPALFLQNGIQLCPRQRCASACTHPMTCTHTLLHAHAVTRRHTCTHNHKCTHCPLLSFLDVVVGSSPGAPRGLDVAMLIRARLSPWQVAPSAEVVTVGLFLGKKSPPQKTSADQPLGVSSLHSFLASPRCASSVC